MFTGIITDLGEIIEAEQQSTGRRFRIATSYDVSSIDIGASIACNGVCLTVTTVSSTGTNGWFEVEAWSEALTLTNAAEWQEGSRINLERSLQMGDELGGHMVSGHVDGMAEIITLKEEGEASRFVLKVPDDLAKFIMPKGSVALNGTSLTVNKVDGQTFDILLIRHTLEVTNWGSVKEGDQVNLEVDQMTRQITRILEQHPLLQKL